MLEGHAGNLEEKQNPHKIHATKVKNYQKYYKS